MTTCQATSGTGIVHILNTAATLCDEDIVDIKKFGFVEMWSVTFKENPSVVSIVVWDVVWVVSVTTEVLVELLSAFVTAIDNTK